MNVLGLNTEWWKQKHYKHHFFTNHDKIDPDISKNYRVFTYPFLLFKWRIDSAAYSFKNIKIVIRILSRLTSSFFLFIMLFGTG